MTPAESGEGQLDFLEESTARSLTENNQHHPKKDNDVKKDDDTKKDEEYSKKDDEYSKKEDDYILNTVKTSNSTRSGSKRWEDEDRHHHHHNDTRGTGTTFHNDDITPAFVVQQAPIFSGGETAKVSFSSYANTNFPFSKESILFFL